MIFVQDTLEWHTWVLLGNVNESEEKLSPAVIIDLWIPLIAEIKVYKMEWYILDKLTTFLPFYINKPALYY